MTIMPESKTFEKREKKIDGQDAYGIFAVKDLKKGDMIYDWKGSISPSKKDRLSTQIDTNKHIYFKDKDFQYYNHSCNPNIAHNFRKHGTYALKDISKDDELFSFYAANEWEMDNPFYCKCGSNNCLGFIGGAKYVPIGKVEELMPMMAPHCQKLLRQKLNQLLNVSLTN